ncbi:MAG: enoyl-CoA hydratase/isomerase family protein [Pusillimonas sp.]
MTVLTSDDLDDGVRVLTLNRAHKHNALDTELTKALLDALEAAGSDTACRALVLTGAGPSFCAGADTGEFQQLSGDDTSLAHDRADLTTRLHATFSRIDKPIVAAVCGNALGGGAGLALACDLVVAADNMRFGYPELKHGIVAAVVMANLVRQLGRKAAFSLVATAQLIDGVEAQRLGLALESLPAAQVLDRAVEIAAGMAAWSPAAMAATKRLFYRVAELPLAAALDAGRDTNIIMRSFRKNSVALG